MNRLEERVRRQIKSEGPISVADYMAQCLLDPVLGYYPTRDPLGSDGDFITAPEISQMFGEVLGLWCIQSWKDMGSPARVQLVELGPGRGIMMSDILRTAQLDPAFFEALSVILIEASSALEAVQGKTLADCGVDVTWANSFDEIANLPTLIIGNEYLDCLPIRQFIQKDRFAELAGWHERLILEDSEGRLAFGLSPTPISEILGRQLPSGQKDALNDDLLELCPSFAQIIDALKALSSRAPMRALFIDYGPDMTEFGDTLQALKRHKKVGVFSDPGQTDLTTRVDFAAFRELADTASLKAFGPVSQRSFLSKLGIELRAVALTRHKPEARPKILRQLHRLMDEQEMGSLFKVICIAPMETEESLGF